MTLEIGQYQLPPCNPYYVLLYSPDQGAVYSPLPILVNKTFSYFGNTTIMFKIYLANEEKVLEKTRESLGKQGDQTNYEGNQLNIHWKD